MDKTILGMKSILKDIVQYSELASALRLGQTIVYPTETCYGIGCDATNSEAVEKVFAIKGREPGKSVLMLAASVAMVQEYVEWNDATQHLAHTYWPGALTMILPVKSGTALATGVIRDDGTVAFRVSAYSFCQALCGAYDRPIVSTSANLAGEPAIYESEKIKKIFAMRDARPDIIIDAGDLPHNPPSTIIRIDAAQVTIIRQGGMIVV
jgi:L-threonylcarbamoyladenylate synthase